MLRPSSASPFHRGQCPITRQPRPAKTPSARHDWRAALIEGSSHVRVFVSGGILTDNVGHCFSAPRHVSWLPSTGWISRPIHQPGRSVADGPAPPQPTHFDGTHTMASHTGASVLKESLSPPRGERGRGPLPLISHGTGGQPVTITRPSFAPYYCQHPLHDGSGAGRVSFSGFPPYQGVSQPKPSPERTRWGRIAHFGDLAESPQENGLFFFALSSDRPSSWSPSTCCFEVLLGPNELVLRFPGVLQ